MSHDWHEGHPGYSPDQVLKDGCAECGWRGENVSRAIDNLDPATFASAWKRATDAGRGELDNVSGAEASLLAALWSVQVQLERRGIPLGELPEIYAEATS